MRSETAIWAIESASGLLPAHVPTALHDRSVRGKGLQRLIT